MAIVVPDYDQCVRFLVEAHRIPVGSSPPLGELIRLPELQKAVFDNMEQAGKEHGLKGFELAKKIHLHAEPFTVENGCLTPTFKLKRHFAKEVLKVIFFEGINVH